jgi:RNA polymerase sigma factor (TIGR02999 family)
LNFLEFFMNLDDLTTLLSLAEQNDQARFRLYDVVQAELVRLAHAQLRGERPNPLLDTSILVNEAFERLYRQSARAAPEARQWTDRRHFFRVAARVMRRIRVDHARRRPPTSNLDPEAAAQVPVSVPNAVDQDDLLVALDRELKNLAERDAQAAEVFEVRFFGVAAEKEREPAGQLLSERETAQQLELTRYEIRCAWARACKYLERQLPALGLSEKQAGGQS